MKPLSRRTFLFACSCSLVALAVPTPAIAAPSRTVIIDTFKDSSGVWRTRIPTDIAAEIGEIRTAELTEVSRRALVTAQSQNLSLPKANGLLTRMAAPVLRARAAGGIAGALLQAGLMVGLTVALASATAELSKDSSTLTMSAKDCANLPAGPASGNMWDRTTGIYRNSSGNAGVAVQRTTGVSGGGSITAPAGWSWAGQRNATSIGNGQFRSEVQFTKNVACGERVAFPPTVPEGTIPGPEHGGNETDTNSAQNRVKIIDGIHREAAKDQEAKKPIPGGEDATVQDPGITIPAPGATDVSPPVVGPNVPGSSYIAPRPGIGNEDTRFTFAPGTQLGEDTTPTPDPTPTPGGTPTPSPTPDWGEPPEGTLPTAPTPFAWVPTPWTAPDLPGSCSGVPYNFRPYLPASGNINPCPVIAQARPVVRPVAVLGWTAYAIAQFLDL